MDKNSEDHCGANIVALKALDRLLSKSFKAWLHAERDLKRQITSCSQHKYLLKVRTRRGERSNRGFQEALMTD